MCSRRLGGYLATRCAPGCGDKFHKVTGNALYWGNVEPGEKGEEDWTPPPTALCGGVRAPRGRVERGVLCGEEAAQAHLCHRAGRRKWLGQWGTLRLSGTRQSGLGAPVSYQNCLGMPMAPPPLCWRAEPVQVAHSPRHTAMSLGRPRSLTCLGLRSGMLRLACELLIGIFPSPLTSQTPPALSQRAEFKDGLIFFYMKC